MMLLLASLHLAIPILGILFLGLRRERLEQQKLYDKTLRLLVRQSKRSRFR